MVGGAVRDELLQRPVLDLDVACAEPRDAANRFARRFGGSVFPLSERHGAWRVVVDGVDETVDFTPVGEGIDADLATRDFTFNAIAVHVGTGASHDPLDGTGRSRGRDHPRGLRFDLPRRSAPPAPRGSLRGRARVPDRHGHGGAPPRLGSTRHGAGGRTRARRARAALRRGLSPPRRRRPARARSADGSTSVSMRSTIPTSGSWPSSATPFGGCRSRTS